jgi:hypothetical protein
MMVYLYMPSNIYNTHTHEQVFKTKNTFFFIICFMVKLPMLKLRVHIEFHLPINPGTRRRRKNVWVVSCGLMQI